MGALAARYTTADFDRVSDHNFRSHRPVNGGVATDVADSAVIGWEAVTCDPVPGSSFG